MPSALEIFSYLSSQGLASGGRISCVEITGIAEVSKAGPHDMTWVSPEREVGLTIENTPGLILARNLPGAVRCTNPKLAFAKAVWEFWSDTDIDTGTWHPDDTCKIGAHNYITHATIGKNFRIGDNCSIGRSGFGYVKDVDGTWLRFPHVGRVIIGDNVEIGSCVCIDRGALGDTIIGNGVKIDNLVHIAHNVVIGDNTLVIANSMIGGSVELEPDVWIAPSVSVMNQAKIGSRATLGMGAVVLKDVEHDATYVGNPAKRLR